MFEQNSFNQTTTISCPLSIPLTVPFHRNNCTGSFNSSSYHPSLTDNRVSQEHVKSSHRNTSNFSKKAWRYEAYHPNLFNHLPMLHIFHAQLQRHHSSFHHFWEFYCFALLLLRIFNWIRP